MIQTSRSATIHFTSKGGSYQAIWMSDRGDLYQEYAVNGTVTTYYPSIDATNPITMHLTVASARTNGLVTPTSVTYYANGTELTFSGVNCTTAGLQSVFRLTADGDLQIIGNLGKVANNANFSLQAKISMSASGADTFYATEPVTLSPYNGADYARVTIAPGDAKNFTISEKGGSCLLKAIVTKGGVEVTSGLTYEWYKFVGGVFTLLSGKTTQTLTVQEADVDSYALYKVVVKENGAELGSDAQGVMDASDPYDILLSTWVNDGSGGNDVSTNDLTLNDEMPGTAYIKFKATLVTRGQTTAAVVSGTKKYEFSVVSGNGTKMFGQNSSTTDTYNVTVANLLALGAGIGDYELVVDCTVS